MAFDKTVNDDDLSAEISRILLKEFTAGELSDEGKARLEQILLQNPDLAGILDELRDPRQLAMMLNTFEQLTTNVPDDLRKLKAQLGTPAIPSHRKIRRRILYLTSAAASIVVIVGAYILLHHPIHRAPAIANTAIDLAPGTNKAILTLANGSKITLDSAHSGLIAKQGKTDILNNQMGQLRYESVAENANDNTPNTVATPNGSQYQLVLSDGTKVWLNAGSSLTFPASFHGHQREVQLRGEGYFEVARNPSSPFVVKTPLQNIEVLGTSFDVSAYYDEPSQTTTLVQGAVRITVTGHQPQTLSPGQQLQLDSAGVQRVFNGVDTDAIISWKDEIFNFNGTADLPAIMRQIGRWYNAPIIYKGSIPNYHLAAFVSRRTPVSKLLEMLSSTHMVSFEITINGIIVTNSNNSKQPH